MVSIKKTNNIKFWINLNIILIITTILLFFSFQIFQNHFINVNKNFVTTKQIELKNEIEDYLENSIQNLRVFLVKHHEIINKLFLNKDESFSSLLNQQNAFEDFIFIDNTNKITYSRNNIIPINSNLTDLDQEIINVVDTTKFSFYYTISDYHTNRHYKEYALFVAIPTITNNKFAGILLAKINTSKIDLIIEKYKKVLPKETILIAKKDDNNSLIIFTNEANEKYQKNSLKLKTPINLALKGEIGNNIIFNKDNIILNSRSFIISTNWAISIQRSVYNFFFLFDILNNFLIFLFLLIIIITFIILNNYNYVLKRYFEQYKTQLVFYLLIFVLILAIASLLYLIKAYQIESSNLKNKIKFETKNNIEKTASLLSENLKSIEYTAQHFTLNFPANNIDKKNIQEFAQKQLNENQNIQDITIYYPINSENTNFEKVIISNSNDNASSENIDIQHSKDIWLKNILSQKNSWIGPIYQKNNNDIVLIYNEQLFDKNKNLKAIISISYSYEKLKEIISALGHNKTNNSLIITKDGTLIYYPSTDFVLDKNKISDIQEQFYMPNLKYIQQQSAQGFSGAIEFINTKTQETSYAFYEYIPINDWTLLVTYSENEFITFTENLYKKLMNIILNIIFIVLIMCFIVVLKYPIYRLKKLYIITIIYSLINIIGIILIVFLAYIFLNIKYNENIISKKIELNKKIEEITERNKNAILVKTGIFINFLNTQENLFSANVWQTFNINQNFTRGVSLENLSGEVNKKELFKKN